MSMNIEDWRAEIDEIDGQLLRLLNRRAKLAVKVGFLKKSAGVPVCDPEREDAVLERVCRENGGPLEADGLARIFRRIIQESRRVEARAVENLPAESQEVLQ